MNRASRRRHGRAGRPKFPAVRYETRSVLGGRYVSDDALKTAVTHSLAVSAVGDYDTKTVCRRIKKENLADEYAGDVTAAPTCPVCLERRAKAKHAKIPTSAAPIETLKGVVITFRTVEAITAFEAGMAARGWPTEVSGLSWSAEGTSEYAEPALNTLAESVPPGGCYVRAQP